MTWLYNGIYIYKLNGVRSFSNELQINVTSRVGDDSCGANFKKFLWDRIDVSRSEGMKLAG